MQIENTDWQEVNRLNAQLWSLTLFILLKFPKSFQGNIQNRHKLWSLSVVMDAGVQTNLPLKTLCKDLKVDFKDR